MNSIWLKIAGIAVLAIVVIVVVGRFQSDNSASSTPPASRQGEKNKTFDQVAERDRQFAQAPKPAEPEPAEQQQQPPAPPAPAPQPPQPPAQAPAQPGAGSVILPSSITKTTPLYFKPLGEEDEIAAEQLLPWASTSRSIGRLPMMSYGPTVKACRDILSRWPESRYAFRAKQMLEDISTSSRVGGFNITQQELDISKFLKQRPGTQKFDVEPIRR
jgi:hypothetical protein